jgi:hypothetical protein
MIALIILCLIFILFIFIIIKNNKSETNKSTLENFWLNLNKPGSYLSYNDKGIMKIKDMKETIILDNGVLRLSNGNCLEAGKLEGDRVSHQKCNDSSLQKWKYEQTNLINAENNLCMETIGNSDEIRMWKCDEELLSQKWIII